MRTFFADTFYYLALLSANDAAHQRAIDFSQQYPARTVTTAWVLTELADGLSAPSQRRAALALIFGLRQTANVTIVPATQHLFERGLDLYSRRMDKDWSLTDCISFVVMEDHGLTEALTGDRHFEQAGFTALLAQRNP
jgi:uncharacterized protein